MMLHTEAREAPDKNQPHVETYVSKQLGKSQVLYLMVKH